MNLAVCDFSLFAPPPDLTVSQWADLYRQLSPEASAEPGRWYTARAEYQRGIMDAIADPFIEAVAIMSSAQIGKTEILNNVVGYFIDQDPSPMLVVQPTLEMAETWSKDRLAPMIRDTERLRGKVREVKSRDKANTILRKHFPGGQISMAGANSPASLASRPVRIVLCDEVDRYLLSAGTEGDPVNLAFKRANNFWNRKLILCSTPGIKGQSRIEAAYEQSDQRKFYVPCPKCHAFQVLKWAQVRWPSPKGMGKWLADKHDASAAVYICESCECEIEERDKGKMLADGQWRAEHPGRSMAGFWINELYSPWVTLTRMVANFLSVKDKPEQFKAFVNTSWGETWEDKGEKIDEGSLYQRREAYPAPCPEGVIVLTGAADVQDDRIEVECVGWGLGEESWSIDYQRFYGSPGQPEVWKQLDDWRKQTWQHENGLPMKLIQLVIDTGGHHAKEAYEFVKKRERERVCALKGSNQAGHPLVGRPTKSNFGGVHLFPVGTDTAKDTIFSRLKLDAFGPGYCHFPTGEKYDEEYFAQLTSEEKRSKYDKGVLVGTYYKKVRARNEALDLKVYNSVALAILNPNLEKLAEQLNEKAGKVKEPEPVEAVAVAPVAVRPAPMIPQPPPRKSFGANPRGRGGWAKGWGR